jgi:hypothetical protein
MSHSSTAPSSPSEIFTTSFELSQALLEPELTERIVTAVINQPALGMAVRHYLYVSWTVRRTAQELSFHQRERESMYDMLLEERAFQEAAFPIVEEYCRRR